MSVRKTRDSSRRQSLSKYVYVCVCVYEKSNKCTVITEKKNNQSYGEENGEKFKFSGYRETRGMYKQKGLKTRINADVNVSYNIMRKVIPTVFDGGIESVVVSPVRITPNQAKKSVDVIFDYIFGNYFHVSLDFLQKLSNE